MSQRFFDKVIICLLVVLISAVGSQAQQQKFSLDDLPHNPYAGPPIAGYGSAEDEFGLGLPASWAGFLGGSPSLFLGFQDSDILRPGPVWFFSFVQPPYYVDCFSYNHKEYGPEEYPRIFLRFSVDRATGGNMPTSASYQEAACNQQPADIYEGKRHFPHPCTNPPPPGMFSAANRLIYDDSFFNLVTGWTYTGPCPAVAPPITIGSHDNIDGFNELPTGVITGKIYFSSHPAEMVSPPGSGLLPGHIYVTAGGTPWRYAPASLMGLYSEEDSIDALVVWDYGLEGECDMELDYALYSLAPGSITLSILGLDAGTIFWTNFNGTSTVYAYSTNLGVGTLPSPPLLGEDGEPNIDALEIRGMNTIPGGVSSFEEPK